MKLWYAPTSPFARKVRIAACELDLSDRIELVEVNPWTDQRLRTINPLGKVPTLVLDDGAALFESAVICDYLDALGPHRRLHPADGLERWRALRRQGLADAASTAAGRLYADEHRPSDERSEAMMHRFALSIESSLDALEAEAALDDPPTIGEISVAAFLGYLDFRWPSQDWRAGRPGVAGWFERFSRRPSMTSTQHRQP